MTGQGGRHGSYLTFRLISCRLYGTALASSYFSFSVPEETFALDAKIASPRIIDYKLLVSLP